MSAIKHPASHADISLHSGNQSIESFGSGNHVLVLPICFDDNNCENRTINLLSKNLRYFRFLGVIGEASPDRFDQLVNVEFRKGIAFVALKHDEKVSREVGVSHYKTSDDNACCECMVTVGDDLECQGVACVLMRNLMDLARRDGFQKIFSRAGSDDDSMRELAKHLGFGPTTDPNDSARVLYDIEL